MEGSEENAGKRSFGDHWNLLKRRRWWILLPTVVIWGAVLGASWLVPARYKSETVVLVEQQKIPAQYVTPNIGVDLQLQLQSMTEQILSRTRLLRIMNDLDLYGIKEKTQNPDLLVEQMRDDITIELVKGAREELSGFKVSYSARDPHIAQAVAQQLTSLFLEENMQNRQELSEDTTRFLESQLDYARKDLEQQELALREFRMKHLGELPDQMQSNLQILTGLQSRLQAATEALSRAEQQRLYLASMMTRYGGEGDVPGVAGDGPLTLEQQLTALEVQLAEANARYTPLHPDVARLKQKISDTERLLQTGRDSAQAKNAGNVEAAAAVRHRSTPALELEGQIKANELEISTRKKDIADAQAEINQYQSRLNLTPVREQQLASLTRNHDQSRSSYESLLAKKMESQMATNLEKRQQGQQFRILDPPSLPRSPYFPIRMKFSGAGLAGGLCFGLALAMLMEALQPRIYSEADVRGLLAAPILGTVPPLSTVEEIQKRVRQTWVEWIAASLLVITVPALTLLTYLKS
ncbi:MAG: Wzz/FepE/Etk N-terminal domain-containing protein [Acidobacteriaceae bacterium]